MLDYAIKLNNTPGDVTELERPRKVGFDDLGIMDIVMIVRLFNFMKRVSHGLGVQTGEAMENSSARENKRALEQLREGRPYPGVRRYSP